MLRFLKGVAKTAIITAPIALAFVDYVGYPAKLIGVSMQVSYNVKHVQSIVSLFICFICVIRLISRYSLANSKSRH